jgi:hypothetical protein
MQALSESEVEAKKVEEDPCLCLDDQIRLSYAGTLIGCGDHRNESVITYYFQVHSQSTIICIQHFIADIKFDNTMVHRE